MDKDLKSFTSNLSFFIKEEMIAFQVGMASLKDRQEHLRAAALYCVFKSLRDGEINLGHSIQAQHED